MKTSSPRSVQEKDRNRFVSYKLLGKSVQRTIGVRKSPSTPQECAPRQALVMASRFVAQLKKFVRKGFELEGKKRNKLSHHVAKSVNQALVVSGVYPDLYMDYTKAVMSMGQMPQAPGMRASLHEKGILFQWDPTMSSPKCQPDDQVMLIAYFPEKKIGIQVLNGEKRVKGEHLLELPASFLPTDVYTYMSFISADHRSITNSNYMGHFTWHTPVIC